MEAQVSRCFGFSLLLESESKSRKRMNDPVQRQSERQNSSHSTFLFCSDLQQPGWGLLHEEGHVLYSIYWFKSSPHPEASHRHTQNNVSSNAWVLHSLIRLKHKISHKYRYKYGFVDYGYMWINMDREIWINMNR